MRPARALIAGLLAASLASCGGKRAPSKAASPARAAPAEPTAADSVQTRRPDIEQLDAEIRRWRVELGLSPRRPASRAVSAAEVTDVCGDLTECTDACNLADKICDNADRICDIAADLADPWATRKCEDAKTSCQDAREVCSCCEG